MRDQGRDAARTESSTGTEPVNRRDTQEQPASDAQAGNTSRRRLLFVAGGLVAGSALSSPGAAAHENHYELGGLTSHWGGEEPREIEGEENPSITFTAGEEYTVTWHNRDGNYHKLLIRDEDGNVLENTPGNGEEGRTESVTFVATERMHDYQCEPHFSMRGDIRVEGTTPESDESATATPTEERTPTDASTQTQEPSPTEEPTATDESTSAERSTPTEEPTRSEQETATGTGASADEATTTGTETAADEATATDGGAATQTDGPGGNGTTSPDGGIVESEDQSVFGVGSLVTGVGGVVYVLRRRFGDGEE